MNKLIRSLLLVSLAAFPVAASAMVSAMPSFYDFGAVSSGRSAMTTITFMNNSAQPVPFFNVNCSGDLSAFSCFSMCSTLPAYGSCSVQVQFYARSGDGMRKMVWLNGSGGGQFATSTVYGTDSKSASEK
ncbi:MAG: hypothetical protein JST04_03695 [Bdellovibrionales bacterium]|nr:hypothetical protein [Bdellovibrionales bacterium]